MTYYLWVSEIFPPRHRGFKLPVRRLWTTRDNKHPFPLSEKPSFVFCELSLCLCVHSLPSDCLFIIALVLLGQWGRGQQLKVPGRVPGPLPVCDIIVYSSKTNPSVSCRVCSLGGTHHTRSGDENRADGGEHTHTHALCGPCPVGRVSKDVSGPDCVSKSWRHSSGPPRRPDLLWLHSFISNLSLTNSNMQVCVPEPSVRFKLHMFTLQPRHPVGAELTILSQSMMIQWDGWFLGLCR